MTGFIFYENDGLRTIHADLMISAKVGENRQGDFPTLSALFGREAEGDALEYIPVSMMQKIVVVDQETAYVWAGRQSDAEKLHRIIERHRKAGPLDPARSIEELIKESPRSETEFAAVVFSQVDRLSFQYCNFNAGPIDFPVLGSVITGGTGEGEFFAVAAELISNLPEYLAMEAFDRGEMAKDASDRIVRKNLIDSLLQFRTLTDTFRNVYTGGGIETVTITGDGIRKPQSTIYLIFVEELFDEMGFSPRFVLKRYYSNNFLGISLYDYLSGGGRHVTIPHPGNIHVPFRFSEQEKDPWTGPVELVTCIIIRTSGVISHFHEDPRYFREHFRFDPENKRIVVSDWYRDDLESKNRE